MTCERCEHLGETRQFATPGLLERGLAVLRANIADGTLREEPPNSPFAIEGQPLFNALGNGSWPDVFAYSFRCSACGTRFELAGETYHGSGARWSHVASTSHDG